jgi:predicted nucleic acid-binding protein
MKVLVSDTSVLIDLERGVLLETAFALSFELAVPDLLYEQELKPHDGARLLELGLRVEELAAEHIVQALEYRRREPALSVPDSFALALAGARQWTLLTGDGALRRLAATEAVECHGVLWVLDQMHDAAVVSVQQLYDGLRAIASHPRCRLPQREIRLRLHQYAMRLQENDA